MNSRRKVLAIMGSLAVALMGTANPVSAEGQTVKVGVLLSLSGPAAPFGIPERDIIKILAEKYNKSAAPDAPKIDLVYYDDQSNPTEAVRGATRLIRVEKVQAIIGAATGSSTLAFAPLAAQAKVPVFFPGATQSVTSKDHAFFPWIFRASTSSSTIISAMMNKVVFQPGITRIGIMYQEDAYGKEEAELIRKLVEAKGGIEIAVTASAPLTATDLSAVATRIRNANPQLVIISTSGPAVAAAFVRGAEQAQLKAKLVGNASVSQQPFVDGAGPAGNGVISMSLGNWYEPKAKQVELGKVLKEANKEPAGYAEIIGSNAIIALLESIKRVKGPIDGQAIRDAAETICKFNDTYSEGLLCYDKNNHDGFDEDALTVVTLRDGHWVSYKP